MYSRSRMRKKPPKSTKKPRKQPAQGRSAETVAVLIEAAARVLEHSGFEGFNTNAVAERAGVSIGSLYQYFRNKEELLAALIERETEPFIAALEKIPGNAPFQEALRFVIKASIQQQMRRPELARLIDFAEKQSSFEEEAKRTVDHAQKVLIGLLRRPDAPEIDDASIAAVDLLTLIRALTDAAGERLDRNHPLLVQRIQGAVRGYLGL